MCTRVRIPPALHPDRWPSRAEQSGPRYNLFNELQRRIAHGNTRPRVSAGVPAGGWGHPHGNTRPRVRTGVPACDWGHPHGNTQPRVRAGVPACGWGRQGGAVLGAGSAQLSWAAVCGTSWQGHLDVTSQSHITPTPGTKQSHQLPHFVQGVPSAGPGPTGPWAQTGLAPPTCSAGHLTTSAQEHVSRFPTWAWPLCTQVPQTLLRFPFGTCL